MSQKSNIEINLTYLGVTTLAKARLAPPKTQVISAFYRPAFAGTARLQHARAIHGAGQKWTVLAVGMTYWNDSLREIQNEHMAGENVPLENLEQLIGSLQQEYAAIFDLKSRNEAKATGYITAISLILASVIGILVLYFSTHSNDLSTTLSKINFLVFIPVACFSLAVLVTSVLVLLPRDIDYIDQDDAFEKALDESHREYLFSTARTYHERVTQNKEVVSKGSYYLELSNGFLILGVVSTVVFVIVCCTSLIL